MYDEDKQDIDIVEQINLENEKRITEAELTRLKTIKQMEENKKQFDEETTKREYLQKLSQALGVNQLREEIDRINLSMEHLAGKTQEGIDQINNLTKLLTQGSTPQQYTAPIQDPTEKLQVLSQLIGPLTEAWKTIRGNSEPQITPLIDQATINEKMKQTFFDNLETGESINNFIKSSLKKSVTKTIINTALKDIGNSSEHGPA